MLDAGYRSLILDTETCEDYSLLITNYSLLITHYSLLITLNSFEDQTL